MPVVGAVFMWVITFWTGSEPEIIAYWRYTILPPSFYDVERKLVSGRPFKAMLAGSMPVDITN